MIFAGVGSCVWIDLTIIFDTCLIGLTFGKWGSHTICWEYSESAFNSGQLRPDYISELSCWNNLMLLGYMASMNGCNWSQTSATEWSLSNNIFRQTSILCKHTLHHYGTTPVCTIFVDNWGPGPHWVCAIKNDWNCDSSELAVCSQSFRAQLPMSEVHLMWCIQCYIKRVLWWAFCSYIQWKLKNAVLTCWTYVQYLMYWM